MACCVSLTGMGSVSVVVHRSRRRTDPRIACVLFCVLDAGRRSAPLVRWPCGCGGLPCCLGGHCVCPSCGAVRERAVTCLCEHHADNATALGVVVVTLWPSHVHRAPITLHAMVGLVQQKKIVQHGCGVQWCTKCKLMRDGVGGPWFLYGRPNKPPVCSGLDDGSTTYGCAVALQPLSGDPHGSSGGTLTGGHPPSQHTRLKIYAPHGARPFSGLMRFPCRVPRPPNPRKLFCSCSCS
jgi:hypothetical protein